MYVIIAYDVSVERVNKVKKYLRTQLTWVQNSLFEGELTDSRYMQIMLKLERLIDKEKDCIIVYKFQSDKVLERLNIGVNKGSPEDYIL